eukprot:205239-Pyramimonas_sp.AAC.1
MGSSAPQRPPVADGRGRGGLRRRHWPRRHHRELHAAQRLLEHGEGGVQPGQGLRPQLPARP